MSLYSFINMMRYKKMFINILLRKQCYKWLQDNGPAYLTVKTIFKTVTKIMVFMFLVPILYQENAAV